MAIFYPSLEKIQNLTVPPEEGEWHLLNFLKDTLNDSYEVFFNPFLNGDRPDIIIMRKKYGVMIIEIKDWKLNNYYLDEKRKWRLKQNNAVLKSPVDQVLQYKKNIYNLHIQDLLEKKLRDYKYWSVVACAVYFHCETGKSIQEFIVNPFLKDTKYQDFLSHNISFLGNDNLEPIFFNNTLRHRGLKANHTSEYFTDDLYKSFLRYFKPPLHTKEQGEYFKYSKRQEELIISSPGDQRIRGVVGSGKTTVLAARAVNAHKRTKGRVLILTFNITLKNNIHDKINRIREDFEWEYFYINNYHNFLSAEMNNLGIEINTPADFDDLDEEEKSTYFEKNYYSNESLFEENKNAIHKYAVILIDEIQDYKRPWMEILKKYFLEEKGEYVIFSDEKQNIYNNQIDNKDIVTNVIGRPSVMKESFRLDSYIRDAAIEFQKQFFSAKYDIDQFENTSLQQEIAYEKPGQIIYCKLNNHSGIDRIAHYIDKISKELGEHPNDICVLGFTIKLLRELDAYIRHKANEKTNAMFESKEIWMKVLLDTFRENESVKKGCAMGIEKGFDRQRDNLAALMVLKSLESQFKEPIFQNKYQNLLKDFSIDKLKFETWYFSQEIQNILHRIKSNRFIKKLRDYRENKKLHFWSNRGTIKLSTIHSFKGWESNTLFLILEPHFEEGAFNTSFAELIYTGITRTKSNLIVLNYGNDEYDESLSSIFKSNGKIIKD